MTVPLLLPSHFAGVACARAGAHTCVCVVMIVECCDAVLQEALRLSRSTQHDAHSLHHDLHAAQKALAEERSRASALAQQLTLLKSADVSVSLWGGGRERLFVRWWCWCCCRH